MSDDRLTLSQMRADVAALLRLDAAEIDDEDNLVDHGLDSLRLMRLAQRWNERGLGVSFAALAERPQLSHWWTLVSGASGGGDPA